MTTEFGVFTPQMRQMSSVDYTYTEVLPVNSVKGSSFVEFDYVGSELFVDVNDIMLELIVKCTKKDGSELGADYAAAPINSLLDTLFKNVNLSINGTHVESSNYNHGYKAVLRHLLMFGSDAKKGQMRLLGYSKDTAGKMHGESTKANWTGGFQERQAWIDQSTELNLFGPLSVDFFLTNGRLLLPFTDFALKLTLNTQEFVMLDFGAGCLLSLVDARLHVRCVRADPDMALQIERQLSTKNAIYPVERLVVSSHTVATGTSTVALSGLFGEQKPKCLVVGMVSGSAYSGNLKENPFNFEHFNLCSLSLVANGQSLLGKPYTPTFDKGLYAREYAMLFGGLRKLARDTDLDISYADFAKGYALFMFNLAGDNAPPTGAAHAQPLERGNLSLRAQFSTATRKSINIVLFAFFDNIVQLTAQRRIITDFGS